MKLWRLMMLPGYALSETARFVWLALIGIFLGAAILIPVGMYADTRGWLLNTAHGWVIVNALMWAFVANAVLLARAARGLRVPTLERDALTSLGLYGGLSIALPALALGWMGGHLLAVAIMLLFGAGLGVAYALLPPYLAVLAQFAGNIPSALSPWLPQPIQLGFSAWAGPLVLLLWLVLAWRIRGLLRGDHSLQSPHAPLLMVFRRTYLGWGSGVGGSRWGRRTPGQGPAWARPKVDLRGCGPGHAERSLRVALGGWWLPQTRISRLWQCALLLVAILAGAFVIWVQAVADRHDHAANLATDLGGAGNVVFFGTLMSALLAINIVRTLQRHWGKSNAELPLLALLPGLGDAPSVKRALLRASLLPALGVQLGLALLLLMLAGVMGLGAEGEAVLLLGPLGSSILMCVFALTVFSASGPRGWNMALVLVAGYVWIGVSAGFVQFNSDPAVVLGDAALLVLALGWSVFFVSFLWLGRRGWRALQRRPHPFLAS